MTNSSGDQSTISVIIPTYNRIARCQRAVDSVLSQTHRDVEVVVVDDGSTDDTGDRLRGRDDRVKYVWQENAGVSAARNRGFREATGQYVAFLDSDDVWMPRKLELQLRVLDHFGEAGMVWSDMDAIDEDGNVIQSRYLRTMYSAYRGLDLSSAWDETLRLSDIWPGCPEEWGSANVHCGDVYASMFMGNLVHTSTVLLRSRTREAVGDFDESLGRSGEDYDYHFRTCAEGRVAMVDLPTILYRVGGADQLTSPELSSLIARNNLRTMRKAWGSHRDRIDLPPRAIKRRWAEAYRWLGEALFDSDPAGSRENLLLSLRRRPAQPKALVMAFLTMVPRRVTKLLRVVRRALRATT